MNKKLNSVPSAGTKDEQSTTADSIPSASVEANPMLAAVLVKAVLNNSWATMLEYFPEGVEHRTYRYNKPEHFWDWDTYEDFSRYVAPAQEMLKDLCLGKALSLLPDCG